MRTLNIRFWRWYNQLREPWRFMVAMTILAPMLIGISVAMPWGLLFVLITALFGLSALWAASTSTE